MRNANALGTPICPPPQHMPRVNVVAVPVAACIYHRDYLRDAFPSLMQGGQLRVERLPLREWGALLQGASGGSGCQHRAMHTWLMI